MISDYIEKHGKIDYEDRRKEILEMIDTKGLSTGNFPFIDCSTSTSPLRDLVIDSHNISRNELEYSKSARSIVDESGYISP